MQTFLDEVAKKIVFAHSEGNQVKVIVPSNRATNFLKEALNCFSPVTASACAIATKPSFPSIFCTDNV